MLLSECLSILLLMVLRLERVKEIGSMFLLAEALLDKRFEGEVGDHAAKTGL